MIRTKRAVFWALCLLIATIFAGINLSADFAAAVDSDYQIIIREKGGGYEYGNDSGGFAEANTLTEIFEALAELRTEDAVQVYLQSITTEEKITLKNHKYLLNGGLTSLTKATEAGAVLTVADRASLAVQGLVLTSETTAIIVNYGGKLEFTSGMITVNNGLDNNSCTAVVVNGEAILSGGSIEYTGKYAGRGLFQGHSQSKITIDEAFRITGNTACEFNSGTATINGGTFTATRSTYQIDGDDGVNTSGYAVYISSSSKVVINGGDFYSRKTPQNTVYLNGNGTSSLDFKGGTVHGKIRIEGKNNSPELRIDGRTFKAIDGIGITVDSPDGALNGNNARITAALEGEKGYKFGYWLVSDVKISAITVLLSELPDGEVDIIADNNYEITLRLGTLSEESFTLPYGSEITLADYATAPDGYEIVFWELDGNVVGDKLFVAGDSVLTAVMRLLPPVLEQFAPNEPVWSYDPDAPFVLVAREATPSDKTVFRWTRLDETSGEYSDAEKGEGNTLTLNRVSDGGQYRCYAKYLDGDYESEEVYVDATVSCLKAESPKPEPVEIEGYRYSRNTTLQHYASLLGTGFSWKEGTENDVPTVGNKIYKGIYVHNGDSENYLPVEADIYIDLALGDVSADWSIPWHENFRGKTFDPSLTLGRDFPLDDSELDWCEPDLCPDCETKAYKAYYNPDSENYEDHIVFVRIYLDKAPCPEHDDEVYLEIPYEPSLTINRIRELLAEKHPGYVFARDYYGRPTLSEPGSEQNNLLVKYNPDPRNYLDSEELPLYMKVIKAVSPIYEFKPSFTEGYSYDKNRTLADFDLGEGWSWQQPDTVPQAGERTYKALYNLNTNYYSDIEADIEFNLTKGVDDSVKTLLTFELTYGEAEYLYFLDTGDGYEWISENVRLYAGSEQVFYAKYISSDPNYLDSDITVIVTVNKAVHDMSGFIFEDASFDYDGTAHSLAYAGTLPEGVTFVGYENNNHTDAGTYTVRCILSQEDEDNYEIVAAPTAVLTVNKIAPVFKGDAVQEFIEGRGAVSASVSVAGGQRLTVQGNNSFSEAGIYTVTFVAEESTNYLRAEFTVTVIIKKRAFTAEKDGAAVKLEAENGIYPDRSVELETVEEKNTLIFKISFDGTAEISSIRLSLPTAYDINKLKTVEINGETAEFTVDGEEIVLHGVTETTEIRLSFRQGGLKGWEIALICIACVLAALGIAAGIIFGAVLPARKKKATIEMPEAIENEVVEEIENENKDE